MKGQDIGILLKLISLQQQGVNSTEQYSVRALAAGTGISKSQVSLALQRCYEAGLAKKNRLSGLPKVNIKSLFEFIVHGLRYVFPARLAEVTRGIPTAFGAPILKERLMSAGELIPVWPSAQGSAKGQAVEPLFPSAALASENDDGLYALLALIDAIRLGQPRERRLAIGILEQQLGLNDG